MITISLGTRLPSADVGEPPSGWCSGRCRCGAACAEFTNHRGPHLCLVCT